MDIFVQPFFYLIINHLKFNICLDFFQFWTNSLFETIFFQKNDVFGLFLKKFSLNNFFFLLILSVSSFISRFSFITAVFFNILCMRMIIALKKSRFS